MMFSLVCNKSEKNEAQGKVAWEAPLKEVVVVVVVAVVVVVIKNALCSKMLCWVGLHVSDSTMTVTAVPFFSIWNKIR